MNSYRIKVEPWRDSRCHRTFELAGDVTLQALHSQIQRAFELDDDHLWAFYISGEFFDRATEFGPSTESRSPAVTLDALSLSAGMRFAYLFDFGDELRHDLTVEAVSEGTLPAGVMKLVEQAGTVPKQYPDEEELSQSEPDASPTAPAPREPPPQSLVELVRQAGDIVDRNELDATLAELLFEILRRVLAACPDVYALDALDEASDEQLEFLFEEALGLLEAELPPARLEPLERQWVRLGRSHSHDHGFPPALAEDVGWVLFKYRTGDTSASARLAALPAEVLGRVAGAILDACPDSGRAGELACEVQGPVDKLLLDHLECEATRLSEADLDSLVQRCSATLDVSHAVVAAALGLAAQGENARASGLLARLDAALATLRPRLVLRVAGAYEAAKQPDRAIEIRRDLLDRRWLSGEIRKTALELQTRALAAAGRAAEAKELEAKEAARLQDERRANNRTTIVRQHPKVGRNEPCPCGSGKKAKKCCGTEAGPLPA